MAYVRRERSATRSKVIASKAIALLPELTSISGAGTGFCLTHSGAQFLGFPITLPASASMSPADAANKSLLFLII